MAKVTVTVFLSCEVPCQVTVDTEQENEILSIDLTNDPFWPPDPTSLTDDELGVVDHAVEEKLGERG
jgi:hypothetical protein